VAFNFITHIEAEMSSVYCSAGYSKYFITSTESFIIDDICVRTGTGLPEICSLPGRGFYCNIYQDLRLNCYSVLVANTCRINTSLTVKTVVLCTSVSVHPVLQKTATLCYLGFQFSIRNTSYVRCDGRRKIFIIGSKKFSEQLQAVEIWIKN
jgi:hypothetical protein